MGQAEKHQNLDLEYEQINENFRFLADVRFKPRTADSRSNPPMMRSDPPDFSPSVIPGIEVRHRLFRISGVSAMVFGGLSLRSESALRNDSVWFLMG
jgi:hypothetical protein